MSGQTYTHTHIHTYTQDNYSNPRCACAPSINNKYIRKMQTLGYSMGGQKNDIIGQGRDASERKYKIATDDSNCTAQRVVIWWFVVQAKESVLEQLQKDWHQVALLTDWKLTPLIQYAKPNLSNNALHQQPNHSQENGTAENASDPSPEKSAISDAQQSVSNTNHMANKCYFCSPITAPEREHYPSINTIRCSPNRCCQS